MQPIKSAQFSIFSWDGNEYKFITNSTGNAVHTTHAHLNGGLARYENRPIAIAGDDNLETEIYDEGTKQWETKTEWKLQFIRKAYNGSGRLRVFPVVSFEKYVVIFGGRWGNQYQRSDRIGSISSNIFHGRSASKLGNLSKISSVWILSDQFKLIPFLSEIRK